MDEIGFVDSHTEGEPTRVILGGGPELGAGSARERLQRLRSDHDGFRRGVVLEPRGSAPLVGALLLPPQAPHALAQVIYFNNVGYLGMCVHGTIGVGRTLAWLGRAGPGEHVLETPVGEVAITLAGPDDEIAVRNVASRRHLADVEVETAAHGRLRGDVAWGGNWFFLADYETDAFAADRRAELLAVAQDVRRSLVRAGVTDGDGGEIDPVALYGPPRRADADTCNFVLCPGGEYDRSPCGTGTSAKLACLAATGALPEGGVWRQEGITGGLFRGTYRRTEGGVIPTISGRAYVTAQGRLLFERGDPRREGNP